MKTKTIQTTIWGAVVALPLVLAGCQPLTMKDGLVAQVADYNVHDTVPPAAITTASAVGNALSTTAIDVTFTPPTDLDYTNTEITFVPAAPGVIQPIVVPSGQSAKTISGLAKRTTYTFALKSVDGHGNKAAAKTLTAKTEPIVKTLTPARNTLNAITADGLGNVYFIDVDPADSNLRISQRAADGTITVLASGLGTTVLEGIAATANGTTVYYTDTQQSKVWSITKNGASWGAPAVFAGTGTAGVPALPATDATTIALTQPSGVAVAPDGTVYIACAAAFHHLIAVIGLTVSELGTLNLNLPTAIAIDPYGNPVVADDLGQTVYRIKKTSGEFFPFGTGNPTGVAVDSAGLVYFVDTSVYAISVYDPVQNSSSTFAGTTVQGFADGPISTAKFMSPRSITVDSQGNLFLIDGAKIREVLF